MTNVPTIKCMICDKKIKAAGFGSHLRLHEMNTKEYCKNETYKQRYEEDNKSAKEYRKKHSPWCLEYYIEKYKNTNKDPKKEFEKAKKKHNSKGTKTAKKNFDNLTDVQKQDRKDRKKATRLKNIMEEYRCSIEDAKLYYSKEKAKNSPRTTIYWENKGFTNKESKEIVSDLQKENSPRSVNYWLKRGYSISEAKKLVSKTQKTVGWDVLTKKMSIDEARAFTISKKISSLGIDSFPSERLFLEYEGYKSLYRKMVDIHTSTSQNVANIFYDKNSQMSLDHIVPIKFGMENYIPTWVLGSEHNVQILSRSKNSSKQANIDREIAIQHIRNIDKMIETNSLSEDMRKTQDEFQNRMNNTNDDKEKEWYKTQIDKIKEILDEIKGSQC